MTEAVEIKADSTAGSEEPVGENKKAAKKKTSNKGVAVKNISGRVVNTSKGSIAVDEDGYCSEAEARQLHRFLERK